MYDYSNLRLASWFSDDNCEQVETLQWYVKHWWNSSTYNPFVLCYVYLSDPIMLRWFISSLKILEISWQELRRLVREATKHGYGQPQKKDVENSDSIDKPKEKLRDYLESLVRLSNEN